MIASQIKQMIEIKDQTELKSFVAEFHKTLYECQGLHLEIFLYLNQHEKAHTDLRRSMNILLLEIIKPNPGDVSDKSAEVLVHAQGLIKATWEEAKEEVMKMKV